MKFPITLLRSVGALITPQQKLILITEAICFAIKTIKKKGNCMGKPAIEVEQYEHHNAKVWVQSKLKGKHREHCLCYECKQFKPDGRMSNCPISNLIYNICTAYNMVLPVWECTKFEPAEPKE